MSTKIPVSATSGGVRELRVRVRERLEDEYLRLRGSERPALLETLRSIQPADGTDPDVVAGELEVVDDRIEAIHRYLGVLHDIHAESGLCEDCCALVDFGDGPQWVLLAGLAVSEDQVVSVDSPLGKALFGAYAGDTVIFPGPSGLRGVRVLAVAP